VARAALPDNISIVMNGSVLDKNDGSCWCDKAGRTWMTTELKMILQMKKVA